MNVTKFFVLVQFVLAVVGCATTPIEKKSLTVTIESNGDHEDCLQIRANQQITLRFTSSKPTDFNIHAHFGEDVMYAVQKEAITTYEDSVTLAKAGQYCLMWTNLVAEPVTLTYQYSL